MLASSEPRSRILGRGAIDERDAERGRAVDAMTDAHQYIHGKKFAVYGDPDYLDGSACRIESRPSGRLDRRQLIGANTNGSDSYWHQLHRRCLCDGNQRRPCSGRRKGLHDRGPRAGLEWQRVRLLPGELRDRGLHRGFNKRVPLRQSLITKGMIWSPNHGDTAFTVPLFDEFMRRIMPGDDWKA